MSVKLPLRKGDLGGSPGFGARGKRFSLLLLLLCLRRRLTLLTSLPRELTPTQNALANYLARANANVMSARFIVPIRKVLSSD
jgi:hypothetical protein